MSDGDQVNILVVDDLPDKLLAYQSILEELGQNLMFARCGEEALKLVLQHEFAVILLDVSMPGINGFETASLIRHRKKSARTPIIFLTAFTDEVRASQGYASGGVDYLPTPVVPEILRAKVQVFIELFQMRRQAAFQTEERARRAAAEEAARRAAFLTQASDRLSRSLDLDSTVQTLTTVTVPFLADCCAFVPADAFGCPALTRTSWAESADDESSSQANCGDRLQELSDAIEQVFKAGKYQLVPEVPALVGVCSSGSQPALDLPNGATHSGWDHPSILLLPVYVRGRVFGAIVLFRGPASPPYLAVDIALAHEFAGRARFALENTLLVQDIQEADHRKDEFLGMLAHELRNPLGPIRNAVHVLQLVGPADERVVQARDMIDRQVTHIARLVDDLLDATRIASGKILLRKECCDLVRIVRQTAADYGSIFEASGLHLEVRAPHEPTWVEGDATRLAQSIGNLLHNAHKYSNPGGQITVDLARDSDGALITVRDSGVGIGPELLGHIFDVFRQGEQGLDRTRGGLGLGLPLVKGLVELHGGQVSAASEGHGRGATFTIRLPVCGPPTTATRPANIDGKVTKFRILVIDDNEDAADSARVLLNLDGHDARTAYSGPEGVHAAQTFCPQVVLCDIGLPGMDGYEVARVLRSDPLVQDAYFIALTGYGRDEDKRHSHDAGFDLHMTKPVDYNNLRRALASLPARW